MHQILLRGRVFRSMATDLFNYFAGEHVLQRGGSALALVIGALTLLFAVNAEAQSNEAAGAATIDRSLARLSTALASSRIGTVLVVGSSSTVGIGASSPLNAYVARLEVNLERALQGLDFRVIGRGVSGEMAQGAADRMQREVAAAKPDLVIWQVGTNDALRHVAVESFEGCLRRTLAWLKEQRIDVILVNPQYGDALVKDAYYENMVASIAKVADEAQVLLVDRFGAMRGWSRDRAYLSKDNLHMNDEGYARLAEQIASKIVMALPRNGLVLTATR